MSQRMFHDLLHKVGDKGFYQIMMVACCAIINFEVGVTTFVNTFLFYQNPYECGAEIENCANYVCSLPP